MKPALISDLILFVNSVAKEFQGRNNRIWLKRLTKMLFKWEGFLDVFGDFGLKKRKNNLPLKYDSIFWPVHSFCVGGLAPFKELFSLNNKGFTSKLCLKPKITPKMGNYFLICKLQLVLPDAEPHQTCSLHSMTLQPITCTGSCCPRALFPETQHMASDILCCKFFFAVAAVLKAFFVLFCDEHKLMTPSSPRFADKTYLKGQHRRDV